MLERRARRAWRYARYAWGSNKSSMKKFRCVYKFSTRFLEKIVFNSSQLSRYCFHCWSIRNIILTPSYDCSLTNLFIRINSSHFDILKEGDLTTLNILRMFISRQRNFASNIISATTFKINNHFNDQVKINKFDVYKGERDELNDWLIQIKLYFAFNLISKNQKTLFAFTYFKEKAQHWFKSKIRSYLDNKKDINNKIFTRFNDFKVAIQRIFKVFNEEQFVEKIIQHFKQHEFAFDYVARFQKYVNIINWNESTFQTIYRWKLKKQVKNEFMRDERAYETLDELIEIFINFDDKLYERVMKKKYDEELKEKIEIYSSRLSSSYFEKSNFDKRQHVDEHVDIVSMKLDFAIRHNKGKNFKVKQNNMKKNKTCYSCDKSSHFAKNCRSREMIPQRQINVMLKKKLDEWNTQNIDFDNSKITKIITNDNYFRIRNLEELQQILNEKITNTTFASTQKINDIIKKAYNKSSYSIERKSHSNEKYDYDNDNMTHDLRRLVEEVEKTTINIKNNATEVVNTLEDAISNDVTRNKEISLPLRFKLRWQNATIQKEESPSICDEYWKNCQNQQCRQHQRLWRQWLNIQRQGKEAQDVSKDFDQRVERRETSIKVRINNLSLTKQRKGKASQWKTHCKSAITLKEPYNK